MPAYGLTAAGFVKKPFAAILAGLQASWLANVDSGADLSATSPDGQIITVFANEYSQLWDLAEAIYESYDPQNAEGASADNLGDLRGVPREGASFTQVVLSLTFAAAAGPFAPGTLVVAVQGNTSLTFTNATLVSSPGATTLPFLFQATASGATPVLTPGTVTIILTPQTNWTAATNTGAQTQLGANAELDAPYLARQATEIAAQGSGNPSATAAALVALGAAQAPPVAVTASVVENTTTGPLTFGVLTLPPNTYAPIIYEPTGALSAAQYAAVIYANKPPGIRSVGTLNTTIIDPVLGVQPVAYTTPVSMPLFVTVVVVLRTGFSLGTVAAAIQAALVAAAVAPTPAGGVPPIGQLAPGVAVVQSQLSAVVQAVPGVADVQQCKFDFHATPTNTAPLVVPATSIATIIGLTSTVNVVVTAGTAP